MSRRTTIPTIESRRDRSSRAPNGARTAKGVRAATRKDIVYDEDDGDSCDDDDDAPSAQALREEVDQLDVPDSTEVLTRCGRVVKSRAQREREQEQAKNAVRVGNNPNLVPEWWAHKKLQSIHRYIRSASTELQLETRPDVARWRVLVNASLGLADPARGPHVKCKVCDAPRPGSDKFCWNAQCPVSPIYSRLERAPRESPTCDPTCEPTADDAAVSLAVDRRFSPIKSSISSISSGSGSEIISEEPSSRATSCESICSAGTEAGTEADVVFLESHVPCESGADTDTPGGRDRDTDTDKDTDRDTDSGRDAECSSASKRRKVSAVDTPTPAAATGIS